MNKIHHSERSLIKKTHKLYALIYFIVLFVAVGFLAKRNNEYLEGILIGVISSSLFGAVLFVAKILSQPYELALQNDLADKIYTRIKDSKQSGIIKSSVGIRSELEYMKDLILKSKKTTIIETWIDESTFKLYKKELAKSLRKGNEVEIFILDPDSAYLPLRGADSSLEDDAKRNIARVENTIKFLESFEREVQKNPTMRQRMFGTKFYIRRYDAVPRFAVYKWSRRAYVGFYLRGVRSTDGCQLRVNMDSDFGDHIKEHIEYLRDTCSNKNNIQTGASIKVAGAIALASVVLAIKLKK